MTVANWIALFSITLPQFIALIWAASKMSSELKHLADAIRELKEAFMTIDSRVDNHESRISVLEDVRRRLN